MLEFINKYRDPGKYSQNGEYGIIAECLKRIDPELKVAVEFGGSDGYYCSNTAQLPKGWSRYLYDPNPKGLVELKTITPENVNELPECSILSIDVDGNDYNIWKAYKGRPDIVIIEINSSIDPFATDPISDPQRGTPYRPMVELGISKGYFLLGHMGNLVFVLNKYRKLFPEINGNGLSNTEKYFDRSWIA